MIQSILATSSEIEKTVVYATQFETALTNDQIDLAVEKIFSDMRDRRFLKWLFTAGVDENERLLLALKAVKHCTHSVRKHKTISAIVLKKRLGIR